MAMEQADSVVVKTGEVETLLCSMEALVVGCNGGRRTHLRALQFGGAATLATKLTAFFNAGSLHRNRDGEENCIPYIQSLYCPQFGHLLRSDFKDLDDLVSWFVDMIVEASLSKALIALTSTDADKLLEHYERDAPILCHTAVTQLIKGAKCVDELDSDSLAEVQLFGITSIGRARSPNCFKMTTTQVPKKSVSKRAKGASLNSYQKKKRRPPCLVNTSLKSEVIKSGQEVDAKALMDCSKPFKWSCPDLTELGFVRYVKSRDWELPEEYRHKDASCVSEPDSFPVKKNYQDLGARPKHKWGNFNEASGSATIQRCPFPSQVDEAGPRCRAHRRSSSDSVIRQMATTQSLRISKAPSDSARQGQQCIPVGREKKPTEEVSMFRVGHYRQGSDDCGSWSELKPPSGGWQVPPPASREQSLLNYIISGQFSKHQASLDQDNAHLILAEAVINSGATDMNWEVAYRADSVSPSDMEVVKKSTSQAEDDEATSTPRLRREGSIFILPDGSPLRERSAEATALQLLLNLRNPHQPKASDLRFLVNEQQAPQKLLPLLENFHNVEVSSGNGSPGDQHTDPRDNSAGTSYQEEEDSMTDDLAQKVSGLRGTLLWAPPRPQLILKVHNKGSVKEAMLEQNFFCNDCGMRVDMQFIHTFRFCRYFGKYCCTTCHTNKTHVLPAHIIYKWDFKQYKVSDFAFNVLQKLSSDPLFAVRELNPELMKRVAKLGSALILREKASKMVDYLSSCRFAMQGLAGDVEELMSVSDPDVLSLNHLCGIKSGNYMKTLKKQMDLALQHVLNCELCCARAFICEGCHADETLFPFQHGVRQCDQCFACFHARCYDSQFCTKCVRIQQRKLRH